MLVIALFLTVSKCTCSPSYKKKCGSRCACLFSFRKKKRLYLRCYGLLYNHIPSLPTTTSKRGDREEDAAQGWK